MKRIILSILILFVSICAYSQDVPTMLCKFSEFISVSHINPETSKKIEVNQTMRIVQGRTDAETLRLDGSLRATNSSLWRNITIKNWETWQSSFVEDFGEVLTIFHDLGENKKVLSGWYKISLVSSNANSTSILIGTCFIE